MCKTCASGQYQNLIGQTSCKTYCPLGQYGDGLCGSCSSGTYGDEYGLTNAVCKTCPSGWDSTTGQSSCTATADACDGAGIRNGALCKVSNDRYVCKGGEGGFTKFAFATKDATGTFIGGGISSTNPAHVPCPTGKTCDGYGLTDEECLDECKKLEWCDTFNYGKSGYNSALGYDNGYGGRCGLYENCDLVYESADWAVQFYYVPLDCRSSGTASGHRCGISGT